MKFFNMYITLIFIIKIIFIGLAIYGLYLKRKGDKADTKKLQNVTYWKEQIDFIFVFLMSLLLIYLFNPRYSKNIVILDYETRLLLTAFGIILLITADWRVYLGNIPGNIKMIQHILGRSNT